MKARLENINKLKETKTGREKLVSAMLQGVGERTSSGTGHEEEKETDKKEAKEESEPVQMEVRDIAEMDRRLGELERAIGSASTAADEVLNPSNHSQAQLMCPFFSPHPFHHLYSLC